MSIFFNRLSYRKSDILNLCMVVLLAFVVLGEIPVKISDANSIIVTEILVYSFLFVIASFINIYRFIPLLLMRGRYFSYFFSLSALVFTVILTGLFFEWKTFQFYPEIYNGFFSAEENKRFFLILYDFITNMIFFSATSIIVFLSYFRKSDDKIRELEEMGVRVELEKARNKIDSTAMFETLDKAAVSTVSSPRETSQMLIELSKSLRRQLYESDHKRLSIEKTPHVFVEQNHLLNFLIEKRHWLARNIIFIIALGIICLARSFVVAGVFVIQIYINVYLLVPRLFFKNKLILYIIASCVLSIIIFAFIVLSLSLFEAIKDYWWLYLIINAITTCLILGGSTAFVLFQRWARNERYIAQLEAATMRAELEQLQNQINPHFLFNMLNNILTLISENPEEAAVILRKLSDMLKYQLNDSGKKEVQLKNDIQFLTDFLNLEKIRRDHFEFSISVENITDDVVVYPLLFIPFVENAVKHSADAVNLSFIRLNFKTENNMLHFTCHNSKPLRPNKKNEYNGLGLTNIKRRLELLYDQNHSLNIQEDEKSYTVNLSIKL